MWFGIWSGPDCYHSVLSKWPGGTGVNFPVLNMHSHAWPLYSATKLLGTEFHPRGIRFTPVIPLDEYEWNSPLLGFKKTPTGYSGWYAPTAHGNWMIEVTLTASELARLKHLSINGVPAAMHKAGLKLQFRGESGSGAPLRWEIS